jgi:type I pantothenate kinase
VAQIYLPLSRLLNLYVAATQSLRRTTDTFLGALPAPVPYVIAIAGSVAVGKSTTRPYRSGAALALAESSEGRAHHHGRIPIYRIRFCNIAGLMARKGFPESYDVRRLLQFMAALKSGKRRWKLRSNSHEAYDIVAGAKHNRGRRTPS